MVYPVPTPMIAESAGLGLGLAHPTEQPLPR